MIASARIFFFRSFILLVHLTLAVRSSARKKQQRLTWVPNVYVCLSARRNVKYVERSKKRPPHYKDMKRIETKHSGRARVSLANRAMVVIVNIKVIFNSSSSVIFSLFLVDDKLRGGFFFSRHLVSVSIVCVCVDVCYASSSFLGFLVENVRLVTDSRRHVFTKPKMLKWRVRVQEFISLTYVAVAQAICKRVVRRQSEEIAR